ncbi:protein disulfide isomerase-like 5-1 [Typha angustifolia]|uniref:protein disulfide isomerase-like 5-1 n=1 Tax=Typha angustifolia TaxID=59011 RepID=UPI003C2F42A1
MDPVLRFRSTILLLILLGLLSAFSRTSAEVITLTEETFTDKVKEKDTLWFVQFCVPWCKHCKKLGTLWEDLGKAMEGEDEIEIGQVDCATSKSICSKVDIHSYPTFKIFYDGEELAKYKGSREVESLKSFILDEADKVAQSELEPDRDL